MSVFHFLTFTLLISLWILTTFSEQLIIDRNDSGINVSQSILRDNMHSSIRIITQSCNYQYFHPNYFWSYMVITEPDLITLLGDSIYLDARPCNSDKSNCASMWDVVCDVDNCYKSKDLSCFNYCWSKTENYIDAKDEYNELMNNEDFTLNKDYSNYPNWPVPVIAIWDDHDYCMDNMNATCAYKGETKTAFAYFVESIDQTNTFTEEIKDLKTNSSRGIYYYYDYNKPILNNNNNNISNHNNTNTLNIRFYNLDVRWYRTKTDILGREQRKWFEDLLLNQDISDIHYHIVNSGSTYYPTFGLGQSFAEPWPKWSKSWFENITSLAGVRDHLIILSGDIHYSAIYRDDKDKTFEIVTSAMTHGIYDIQAWYLKKVQNSDGYLQTDIINDENIGILDLQFNQWSMLYIDNEGQVIYNFSYNYLTDDIDQSDNTISSLFFNYYFIIIISCFFMFV